MPTTTSPLLRVRSTATDVVDALGPGRRSVVWVQGCSIHCPGCMVPETWTTRGGQWVDPVDLARQLLEDDPEAALTVSGGEPTEQAPAVGALLAETKRLGRTTWVYTGRTLESLMDEDNPAVLTLLSHVDVLVDGPYLESMAGAIAYRGSTNQRILRLTEAISARDIETVRGSRVDIRVDSSGWLQVIGAPPPAFLRTLQELLAEKGISLTPEQRWT